jgi:16S rRNA (uracil1498-N3)-methyltransferase
MRRFWVPEALQAGAVVTLSDALQHRLRHVLRLAEGDVVGLWNGRDGLWAATLTDGKTRAARVQTQQAAQPAAQGPVLAVGLPKREAWELVLRQATELGAQAIVPLKTAFAQVGKINPERVQAIVQEAAEQCERLTLPDVPTPQPLPAWLAAQTEPLLWLDARGTAGAWPSKIGTVLVGPEGGFSPEEEALLAAHPLVRRVTLATPVLRVETAVVAALGRLA